MMITGNVAVMLITLSWTCDTWIFNWRSFVLSIVIIMLAIEGAATFSVIDMCLRKGPASAKIPLKIVIQILRMKKYIGMTRI